MSDYPKGYFAAHSVYISFALVCSFTQSAKVLKDIIAANPNLVVIREKLAVAGSEDFKRGLREALSEIIDDHKVIYRVLQKRYPHKFVSLDLAPPVDPKLAQNLFDEFLK